MKIKRHVMKWFEFEDKKQQPSFLNQLMQNSLSDFLQNFAESNRFQNRSADNNDNIKVLTQKTGRKSGDLMRNRNENEMKKAKDIKVRKLEREISRERKWAGGLGELLAGLGLAAFIKFVLPTKRYSNENLYSRV